MNATSTQHHALGIPRLRPCYAAAEAALRTLSVGELDASTLALVIGSDPALTAALIRASEPADSAASIAERIAGLTPSRLQSALFAPLAEAISADSPDTSISAQNAWQYSLALAIAAEAIARHVPNVEPASAYLAGLLARSQWIWPDTPEGDEFSAERFQAIARAYRFPRWLVEATLAFHSDMVLAHATPHRELRDVLTLARQVADAIVRHEARVDSSTFWDDSRPIVFERQLDAAIDEANHSFRRRLSLFNFTPSQVHELRGPLLRFANQVLLNWRVDQSAADSLRKRVTHLEAVQQFNQCVNDITTLDDLAATGAAAMREPLQSAFGACVVWTDIASPAAAQWMGIAAPVESANLAPPGETSNPRGISRQLMDIVCANESSAQSVPCVLPVRTPSNRLCGYIAAAEPETVPERWLEQCGAWANALGAAVERIDDAQRDAQFRQSLRPAVAVDAQAPVPEIDKAAHDYRNMARATVAALHGPLSMVTSQAHQLLSRQSDETTRALVEGMAKQARDAARVMADLQIIAQRPAAALEPVLVNAPLRQFLHGVRSRLERRSIEMTEHFGEGLPRIKADSRTLHHLFGNLFSYIEQRLGSLGRAVDVKTIVSDDRAFVQVVVSTSSLHLSPTQADTLFDPLTGEDATVAEYALSLATCRSIVADFGGEIRAACIDDGVQITIAFPSIQGHPHADDSAPRPPAIQKATPRPVEMKLSDDAARVLIVDDDDGVRDIIRQAMKLRGYRTEVAKDGEEAMQILHGIQIDAIILDLMMPQHNGFAMLRDLQQIPNSPPVIFMTGSGSPDVREDALDLGATVFLKKPFELRQLLAELESVLVLQRK